MNQKEAAIKHLNRLTHSGHLVKLSKGKYYKPEQSRFGEVPVSEYQMVKDLLEQDSKIRNNISKALKEMINYDKAFIPVWIRSIIEKYYDYFIKLSDEQKRSLVTQTAIRT